MRSRVRIVGYVGTEMSQFLKSTPTVLYKFRSDVGRDVGCLLKERQLYCVSPLGLNDPFDCLPRVQLPPPEARAALIEAAVAEAPPEREQDIRRRCHLISTSPAHRERYLEEFYREDLGRLGVLSLSATRDSPLLWAHYANNSKGFAVGYRGIDSGKFEALGALPVRYASARPVVDPFGRDGVDYWLAMLFTKSEPWAYEEEWRYVRIGEDGGPGLMAVPKGCIVEVCLGSRMSEDDRNAVVQAARALPDRPQIFQTRLMPDRFGLAFDSIE